MSPTLPAAHDTHAPPTRLDGIRRVVITDTRHVELHEEPLTDPGPGEALVRHDATLFSAGTELSVYRGTNPLLRDPSSRWMKYPFRPGYAAVGRVVRVGEGEHPFRVGQGLIFDGAHASTSVLNAQRLYAEVPEPAAAHGGLPVEGYLMARMAQIAATALLQTPPPARRVLVVGAGVVGLLAAQLYRHRLAADVTVLDRLASRIELAQAMGIDGRHVRADEPWPACTLAPDIVVEATGVPALVDQAMSAVKPRGTVVLLGAPAGSHEIDLRGLFASGRRIVGAHETLPDRAAVEGEPTRRELLQQMVSLIAEGQLNVLPLLSEALPASDAAEAYRRLDEQPHRQLTLALSW